MLGNLSKILIRTPDFFNNSSLNITKDSGKINHRKNINVLHSNSNNRSRKYNRHNIYFRERDFWLKNYEPEINYNHNRRLPFSLKNKRWKDISDRKIFPTNKENKVQYNTIESKRSKYNLTDRKNLKDDKSSLKTIHKYYKINPLNTTTNSGNELCLKTQSIGINRKILGLGGDDERKSDYNSLNIIKEKNIKNNKKNKKYKYASELPSIYKSLKSQENLFQDRLDKKFNSLKLLRPEIKEQLKTKNRSMVGRKVYLKYKNLNRANFPNPFCESIKFKEELGNYKQNIF